MRLPDDILECVAFLALQQDGDEASQRQLVGTGFFLSVPGSLPGVNYIYLITAKHCVSEALELGELYVRLNTRDGGLGFVKLEGKWLYSDIPGCDLAVLPFAPNSLLYKYKHISDTMLAQQDVIERHKVGIGEEVAIAGLFTRRAGKGRNIPIVRCGSIAAMPAEPLPEKDGPDFHAYLVEVRSIGGLSGSPVFAYLGPARVGPDFTLNLTQTFLFLIGVMRGHWEHEEAKVKGPSAFSDGAKRFSEELDLVNWGIAAVTPSTELAGIIYGDYLMKGRERKDKELAEADSPVNDSAIVRNDKTFTKEDFDAALKKASRKIVPKR